MEIILTYPDTKFITQNTRQIWISSCNIKYQSGIL